ncbi:hypothetical protein HY212_04400 [Candidatus Pacearchaeota archaeon]|nr:hypothetical protein [Candidatus Pacearchaeota archaeon]
MQELIKFLIGILVLALGVPIGNYLAKLTKEELKSGQMWFKLIIILSIVGAVLALVFRDDVLLFTLPFIAIITSRSLVTKTKKR